MVSGGITFDYNRDQMQKQDIEHRILSEIGLRHILDIDKLQGIQDHLAKISGLSMVIVDSKGIPITKETSFSDFCKTRREIFSCKQHCIFSDAYGGLKAAMQNAPYIYRCPGGLVDCAIPISINGQYVCAVLMGQVRTNSYEELENVGNLVKIDNSILEDPFLLDKYHQTPIVEMDKIKLICELAHFLIREMTEKQIVLLIQKEYEKENNRLAHENELKDIAVEELKRMEKRQIKNELNPQFIMSIMNSISNLSLIEGAEQTNELVCLFSESIRYNFETHDAFVPLNLELANIKNYLKIQEICLGDKFDYDIIVNCSIVEKRILSLVILPFVENAIIHGLAPKKDKGKITIIIDENEEDYTITVKDNGIGIHKETIQKMMKMNVARYESEEQLTGLSISNTRRRLIKYFGHEYDIQIKSNEQENGITVTITIPLLMNS